MYTSQFKKKNWPLWLVLWCKVTFKIYSLLNWSMHREHTGTHLFFWQGLVAAASSAWSQCGPPHPGWQRHKGPAAESGWHSPFTQRSSWQARQPGTTPGFICVRVKSCSSLLMYRFRIQPWKLEPLRDGHWFKDSDCAFSGIPDE